MTMASPFRRNVLVSIRPAYASKILEGLKTVELRRKFPKETTIGATAVIYSSSPVCAIVGYARIKDVHKLRVSEIWKQYAGAACIARKDFDAYFSGLEYGFAIFLDRIKSLVQHLKADELENEFGLFPPQSFRYLTEEPGSLLHDERLQTSHRYKHRHRA